MTIIRIMGRKNHTRQIIEAKKSYLRRYPFIWNGVMHQTVGNLSLKKGQLSFFYHLISHIAQSLRYERLFILCMTGIKELEKSMIAG